MSVTRDITKVRVAMQERMLVTCSTGNQSLALASTAYLNTNVIPATTGVSSCAWSTGAGGVVGDVLDRLDPELGARFGVVDIYAYLYTTRGSTQENGRGMFLDCYLTHGASSGGGDMANLSSERKATRRQINASCSETGMYSWSTGLVSVQTSPASWDISAASRYLRVVVNAGKTRETTESSGYENAHIGAAAIFREADVLPPSANTTGPFSTTTSTST